MHKDLVVTDLSQYGHSNCICFYPTHQFGPLLDHAYTVGVTEAGALDT